ncbi:DUF6931 family protein, partial [Azospirillum oryzae]
MPKLRFARAAEAVAGLDLSAEAKALFAPNAPTSAYLKALIDAELYADAIRLLGIALPRREAVWWGCLAARGALPAEPAPADGAALEAAEA